MPDLFARFTRLVTAFLGLSSSGPPVELLVIGAGLARTGTSSLQSALGTLLSGQPVHHFENLVTDATQQRGWALLRDGHHDPTLLRALVDGHVAAVDVPAALHYRALMKEYPRAKVILTTHPKGSDGWYKSVMGSIWHVHMGVLNQSWIGSYAPPFKGFHKVGVDVFLDNPFFLTRDEWLTPAVAKRKYEQHNAAVRRHVPRSRLLVYSVDQGWEPLCKFLGKPVPARPFPRLNDTATLRAVAAVLTTLGVLLPILPCIIGFLRC